MRRDEVVDLLWRDVDEDKARNAFRQALHRLRTAVGEEVLPPDRERLRLVTSPALSVDLDKFRSAVTAGRYAEAIETYRGDFLEGVSLGEPAFDMWVEHERAGLRARFRQILTESIARACGDGRWEEAIAQSQRLHLVSPLEAEGAQLAATTLIAAGRGAEARDLIKRFEAMLHRELGLALPTDLAAMLNRLERQSQRLGDATTTRPAPRATSIDLPFVGRESEVSRLVALCRTSAEDAGGLALIEGDVGYGKTRLLRELEAHLKSLGGMTVLRGREHPGGFNLPYVVFAEALRPLVRAPGVLGASPHLLAEASRLLPELRDEMDLPAAVDVDDDVGRLRFFEGVAALIDATAFEKPVILVLDDMHFSGPSTLDLFQYLSMRLARSAVTFVVSIRPSEAPASTMERLRAVAAAASPHAGRTVHIELAPLSGSATREIVERLAGELGLKPGVGQLVQQQSGGVPSRLEEFLRRAGSGEELFSAPVSFRQLVDDRLSRISSAQRRLVFVLALLGRPVRPRLAAAAAHLSEAAAQEALETLDAHGLLEPDLGGSVATTEVVTQAAHDLAGAATRGFLAGWIAETLATEGATSGELARYYAMAGESRPAFEHSRRAALSAIAIGAVPEATQHLHAARTFASTPDEQRAVESLLSALGAGRWQLSTSDVAERPVAQHPRPTVEPAPASPPEAPSKLEGAFPNWRILLGAAVATLVVSAGVLLSPQQTGIAVAGSSEVDTLWLADDAAGLNARSAIGNWTSGFTLSSRRSAPGSTPAWIDSLSRQWSHPLPDPRGHYVAVTRITGDASALVVIAANRADTTFLVDGARAARALSWSPDGRWLLASVNNSPGGNELDSDLIAFSDRAGNVVERPIDATVSRSIVEASWSPDGTRIAWVARAGADRQLEVFVSNADGSEVRNVSRDPADDQHIAWSPDGELLAFTSTRDGNPELYAVSFLENRLWRLTSDSAQDDAASFSPNGRFVVFESTRGGTPTVYMMPALGGEPRAIAQGAHTRIIRWQDSPRRYVDRIVVDHPPRLRPRDTVRLRVLAFDQFDQPIATRRAQWSLPDSTLTSASLDSLNDIFVVVPRAPGLIRVTADVGRWRADTAYLPVGSRPIALVDSSSVFDRAWQSLGDPSPFARARSVVLLSDREWDSGILSRMSFPLLPGLTIEAGLRLPIDEARDPAMGASVSLVAPEDAAAIDASEPQFLRLASLSWNAESERLVYAVGREIQSERVSEAGPSPMRMRINIEQDSTVRFSVNGRERWRSTLRVTGLASTARAQVWISTRATAGRAELSGLSIRIDSPAPGSP